MRVLITGGTGVIGAGVIPELLRRAHAVRLLSRHAEDDAKQWKRVEPFSGNVAEPQSLRGAAGGCDAVIHIAGGTRNVVAEAVRAGVPRFSRGDCRTIRTRLDNRAARYSLWSR